MLEYKQVIRPCIVTSFDQSKWELTLFNRRYFTDLSDLDLYWAVEVNGKKLFEGKISNLDVAPQQTKSFKLQSPSYTLPDSEFCYLNILYKTNSDKEWANCGHVVGKEQIAFSHDKPNSYIKEKRFSPITCIESDTYFIIKDDDTEYSINRRTGNIEKIQKSSIDYISTAIDFNIWRAPTDNDRNIRLEWEKLGYDRIWTDCRQCRCSLSKDNTPVITAELVACATSMSVLADIIVSYTFSSGNGITIRYDVKMRNTPKVTLPRLGVQFQMPAEFEYLKYFGLGPTEAYWDKRLASQMGIYQTTVTEHFEPYIKPQENMAHADTIWAQISNKKGDSLLLLKAEQTDSFSFNCSHYTPMQLTKTKHNHELTPLSETVVNIDYMQCGIGSNSCGPKLDEAYTLKNGSYNYSFRLFPVKNTHCDPFELL